MRLGEIRTFILYLTLVFASGLQADIINESGSLREFIGGSVSTTEYDNYVSHVSEGIASPGYNEYAPDWVDVQTNGFGNYRIIDNDAYTLVHWRRIFEALDNQDFLTADGLLQDSVQTFHYDLIRFLDTDYDRTYFMLRERLNLSYVDANLPTVIGDEVTGSFANGWGLFIINPSAQRQQLIIEAPHPCDDFISPYFATEMFLQNNAYALAIAGAGREVKWTQSGDYSNNKSLSDPSRNANTPFQVFHEVLSDSRMDLGPHAPLVIHTHSFDDNNAHAGFQSIVLSGGWDAWNANKPIRDLSDDNLDLINFTAEYPIAANTFGNHPAVRVDEFYRVHYEGSFLYHGQNQDIPMPHTYTLLGPNTGVQMNYLRQFFYSGDVYEPWVQVELFEKPLLFQDMNMPLTELYAGDYPSSRHNYQILMEYYQPFIDALEAYLVNWESVPDETAPDPVEQFRSTYDGLSYINVAWNPVFDTNHKTYSITYDTESITENSPVLDASTDRVLANPSTDHLLIDGLDPDENYIFQIQALDYFDHIGPPSPEITDSIPGHQPINTLQNFDSGEITLSSFADQDDDPDAWSLTDARTYMSSDYSLVLTGNTWKVETMEPYPLQEHAVFQIAAYVEHLGEIQGLGFQDSLNTLYYALDGNEQLDIDEWVTVDQGAHAEDSWVLHRMPVGDDWVARFDYLPRLTSIIYINDRDSDPLARVYFDELVDISNAILFSPEVSLSYSYGSIYRDGQNRRSIDVDFESMVIDADSDFHTYLWQFGDGETSNLAHPSHHYALDDDHNYSVLLQVTDESGNRGQGRLQISLEEGSSSFPLTMNFVGDIMIARRYIDEGLVANGVDVLFEPTLDILGNAADLTVANLECTMTIDGEEHPTKSVTYKGHPDHVSALANAGIDLVSLANNHTLDYGLVGLRTTQQALDDNGILHSGSGGNSMEAYQPLFTNNKGVSIAWLANCDRTGQYNNSQPYLNAGYNKPGFAYLTPYYLQQQILAVRDVADLVVMEMHAGSEYSSEPGAGYDQANFGVGIAPRDWIAPRELTQNMDLPQDVDEDENYSPLLDVPHMWDREIRHFAIDSGADLVVVHHPHIIQGLEVYQGKLIAHSLGNFMFDLNYHETFPSIVLNAEVGYTGFEAYSLTPVYIDDYIPVPALGELGTHLLDYLAAKSRELDTYVYVDKDNSWASVWLDTLSMPRTTILNRHVFDLSLVGSDWVSPPLKAHEFGSVSNVASPSGTGWDVRLGRELLWYGNMESEGASEWNLNSSDEYFDLTEAYRGQQSIGQHRIPSSGDNVVTNLENRIRLNENHLHHLSAWIKTQNGRDVTVEVRYYSGRTSTTPLATHAVTPGIDGTTDWTYYHAQSDPPNNATYFDLRLSSDTPPTGDAYSWFDDVSFVEWESWLPTPVSNIPTPNDAYFIQLRNSSASPSPSVEFETMIYSHPEPVSADFTSDESIVLVDQVVQFTDLSTGPVGWWAWDFGDGNVSQVQHPSHSYTQAGIYDVSLTIMDPQGFPVNLVQQSSIRVFEDFFPGDLNFDGQNTVSDIVILVAIIIGDLDATEAQASSADLNSDTQINVQDLVSLINIILYN